MFTTMPGFSCSLLCLFLATALPVIDATQTFETPLATDTYRHLLSLIRMPDKITPNPRISCTNGYQVALDYVTSQMAEIGLVPLGNHNRTTYENIIPESKDPEHCPPGKVTVLGMVEGTTHREEYVFYVAHLDGPYNENPQTERTRGLTNTDNTYNNGLAVAMGLAIAKELQKNPPKYSVVFLFDDGHEDWANNGARKKDNLPLCYTNRYTDWWNRTYINALGKEPRCSERCADGGCSALVGVTHWIRDPTISSLENIKFWYSVGPFGTPTDFKYNMLGIVGADTVVYNAGTAQARTGAVETLDALTGDDFINEMVPPNSTTVTTLNAPRLALDRIGSSFNVVNIRKHPEVCSPGNCLEKNGVPSAWLVQPSFQQMYGGAAIDIPKEVFGNILTDGTLASTAYFSTDNFENLNLPHLDHSVDYMMRLIGNTANSDNLEQLSYDGEKASIMTHQDLEKGLKSSEVLELASAELPKAMADFYKFFLNIIQSQMRGLRDEDLNDPEQQRNAFVIAQSLVALLVSMDFFYPGYPNGEAFLDQSFNKTSDNIPEPEEFAPPTIPPVRTLLTASPTPNPTKAGLTFPPTMSDGATTALSAVAFVGVAAVLWL